MSVTLSCEVCKKVRKYNEFQTPDIVHQLRAIMPHISQPPEEFDVCMVCWQKLTLLVEDWVKNAGA